MVASNHGEHNPENERMRHKYSADLGEAKRHKEATVDAVRRHLVDLKSIEIRPHKRSKPVYKSRHSLP